MPAIEQMDSRESAETLADTEAEQVRRVLGATNGNESRSWESRGTATVNLPLPGSWAG
jgi:hypothetical protein